MDRPAADPLVGQVLDGRYLVSERIARGGMATVYEATDLRLDRVVALKVMPPGLACDPDFGQRFVREARASARLAHAKVVTVYDQGDDNGILFLAMEYVAGRHTLRDVIRDEAPLAPTRALALLEEILEAIAAAHESGIVHRDIKPENVLITPRGQVKVADFGLARAITSATSATATGGVLMGTVSYLPPELVTDGIADARSDVYSLGVLLFELLTGTKPHAGESPIQVAYKHVHDDVPAPSGLVDGVPPYLDALVARATARQRDLRPADAHVMLRQLRRVRQALDSGVLHDQELSEDLTPTIAIAARSAWAGPSGYDDLPRQDGPGSVGYVGSLPRAAERVDAALDVAEYIPMTAAPPPPRPRRRRLGGWVAFLVVLILAAVAAAAGWYYGVAQFEPTPNVGSPADGPRPIRVPDSSGDNAGTARSALQALGFAVETSERYDDNVPAGDVIAQHPARGIRHDGDRIALVVSRGPRPVEVPDVKAYGVEAAQRALEASGFKVDVQRYEPYIGVGYVVSQSPSGHATAPHGSTVTIDVI